MAANSRALLVRGFMKLTACCDLEKGCYGCHMAPFDCQQERREALMVCHVDDY